MYLRVVAVLVSLSVVLCHKTLTHDAVDAELNIPENNERGAKIVSMFLDNVRTQHKMKAEAEKKMHEARIKEHLSSDRLQSSQGDVRAGEFVTHGYFLNRTRPFADCTGPVSYITGSRLECNGFGTTSFGDACMRDAKTGRVIHDRLQYASNDCSGPPVYRLSHEVSEECEMDVDSFHEGSGFQMNSVQCSPQTSFNAFKAPGIMISAHMNAQCNDDATFFANIRFNACTLVLDRGGTYSYIKFTRCMDKGRVEMILYSDASCQRPMFRAVGPMHTGAENCESIGYGAYWNSECIN